MSENISRYDDANFTIIRQANVPGQAQAPVSLTDFAHFQCRNRCIVHAVNFRLKSAASVAGGSLVAVRCRNTPSNSSVQTIASYSLISATSAGSLGTITLASLNTLESLSDYIAVRLKSNDKGKWDIVYEYQLLPSATKIP